MSETKHSRFAWTVCGPRKDDEYIYIEYTTEKVGAHTIAVVRDTFSFSGDRDETVANARLIAAEPELLAAAIEAAKQLRAMEAPAHARALESAIAEAVGGE